tara:strand:- start:862 stop:1053 length:192 start_codon:yes stop_codon:yes gene_type:complete
MIPLLDDEDVVQLYTAVWIPLAELQILLSQYDVNSATSPSVVNCRPIVRAILDKALSIGIEPS